MANKVTNCVQELEQEHRQRVADFDREERRLREQFRSAMEELRERRVEEDRLYQEALEVGIEQLERLQGKKSNGGGMRRVKKVKSKPAGEAPKLTKAEQMEALLTCGTPLLVLGGLLANELTSTKQMSRKQVSGVTGLKDNQNDRLCSMKLLSGRSHTLSSVRKLLKHCDKFALGSQALLDQIAGVLQDQDAHSVDGDDDEDDDRDGSGHSGDGGSGGMGGGASGSRMVRV